MQHHLKVKTYSAVGDCMVYCMAAPIYLMQVISQPCTANSQGELSYSYAPAVLVCEHGLHARWRLVGHVAVLHGCDLQNCSQGKLSRDVQRISRCFAVGTSRKAIAVVGHMRMLVRMQFIGLSCTKSIPYLHIEPAPAAL